MNRQPHDSLKVLIHDEGKDGLWAEVPAFPGCFASGQNLEELREALGEALSLYLSEENQPVHVTLDGPGEPVPSTRVTEQKVLVC